MAKRTVHVLRISGCTFYAFTGAFTGVAAIMSMVMIGYDRYNVIVKVKNKYCFKISFVEKYLFSGTHWTEDNHYQSFVDDCHCLCLCFGNHNCTSARLGKLQIGRISDHMHL